LLLRHRHGTVKAGVNSMRAPCLLFFLLLSACDTEVLVDVDAGIPDAGVPDAGFADAGVDVDAGFDEPDAGPEACDVEDLEFAFECEPDADWCSPRDQFHAYYDLAAGWSHQLDEETWVVEVRLYGRLPLGAVYSPGIEWWSKTALLVNLNSGEAPTLGSASVGATPTCAATTERYYASDRDFLRVIFDSAANCDRCPPTGAGGVGRECEQDRNCTMLSVSEDLTAFRFEFGEIAPELFWSAWGVSDPDLCSEYSAPQFARSRGGSIDNVIWMPAEYALTCPDDP
jgi:hypothetical protein